MFFQFISENGQAKPLTQKSLMKSKNLTFLQYINNGYIMLVTLKTDRTFKHEDIEKLISRNALQIENITFSRTN